MRLHGLLTTAALALLLAGCTDGPDRSGSPASRTPTPSPAAEKPVARLPVHAPYEPPEIERYRNGKRLAARIAQAATTYDAGATPTQVAREIPDGDARLAPTIEPLVERGSASTGKIAYVQLSGVTRSSLATMVITRQTLARAGARPRTVNRVIDVRLRRSSGPWSLERIGSVGGSPARRPSNLSPAAGRVLEHPRLTLTDSARWDIHRGDVDDRLLQALADAADQRRISVSVLRSGHPRNVWATSRSSAHATGYAADIYAVDGALVLRQRYPGSPAYRLATGLVAGQADQVGSPWPLPPGGRRAFSDAVHQDHIHLQQSPRG